MEKLKQQIRTAYRRLLVQRFLKVLPWTLFGALLIASVAICIPKLVALDIDSTLWLVCWLGGSLIAAVGTALLIVYFKRIDFLTAAVEIDQRFQLKERVASSLSLSEAELETPAGQALLKDAVRRINSIDVREEFRYRLGRPAWLPFVPAAIVLLLVFVVGDKELVNPAQASPGQSASKQVKKSAKVLHRKIAERRKKAQQEGLKDAAGLFKKLEQATKQLSEKEDADRKKARVQLNDLARQLESRRKALGGSDEMKKQLNRLNQGPKGPAEKLIKAMREGDLQEAINQIKQLQEKLNNSKLSEQEKKQLAEQLDKMKQQLQQAVDQNKQAMQDLQRQVEQARNSGDTQQASKLQEQLDKLASKMPQMDKLSEMAQKMGDASKNIQNGNADEAAKQLDSLAQDMKQMQQQLGEIAMLDDALEQIDQAKCDMCEGNQAGQNGQGKMPGQGQGQGKGKGNKKGNGMGEGKGEGFRPEQETETNIRDSRVRQNVGKGKAVITDMVRGQNIKGQVRETIETEISDFKSEESDPLTEQRLPRNHRDHAREYFDSLRNGK